MVGNEPIRVGEIINGKLVTIDQVRSVVREALDNLTFEVREEEDIEGNWSTYVDTDLSESAKENFLDEIIARLTFLEN